jgi:hypothetical protein
MVPVRITLVLVRITLVLVRTTLVPVRTVPSLVTIQVPTRMDLVHPTPTGHLTDPGRTPMDLTLHGRPRAHTLPHLMAQDPTALEDQVGEAAAAAPATIAVFSNALLPTEPLPPLTKPPLPVVAPTAMVALVAPAAPMAPAAQEAVLPTPLSSLRHRVSFVMFPSH